MSNTERPKTPPELNIYDNERKIHDKERDRSYKRRINWFESGDQKRWEGQDLSQQAQNLVNAMKNKDDLDRRANNWRKWRKQQARRKHVPQ